MAVNDKYYPQVGDGNPQAPEGDDVIESATNILGGQNAGGSGRAGQGGNVYPAPGGSGQAVPGGLAKTSVDPILEIDDDLSGGGTVTGDPYVPPDNIPATNTYLTDWEQREAAGTLTEQEQKVLDHYRGAGLTPEQLNSSLRVFQDFTANQIAGQQGEVPATGAETPAESPAALYTSNIINQDVEVPTEDVEYQDAISSGIIYPGGGGPDDEVATEDVDYKDPIMSDIIYPEGEGEVATEDVDTPQGNITVSDIETGDISDYDVENLTPGGDAYEAYHNAVVNGEITSEMKNAQQTADKNMSARQYYMMKQAKEAAAAAGYKPGTQQYEDMMKQARADVNNANLQEQNQVNADRRNEFQKSLDALSGLEEQAYQRAYSERGFETAEDARAWDESFAERGFASSEEQREWDNNFADRGFTSAEEQREWSNDFAEQGFTSSEEQREWANNFAEEGFESAEEQREWMNDFRKMGFDDQREARKWLQAFQEKGFLSAEQAKEWSQARTELEWRVGREDVTYLRDETLRLESKADVQSAINNLKDPKARAYAQAIMSTQGHEAVKKFFEAVAQNDGELPDAYKSMTPAETQRKAAEDYVNGLSTDPRTGDDWEEGAKEEYTDLVNQTMWEAEYAPLGEAGDEAIERRMRKERVSTFLETGDATGMGNTDWDKMTPTDINTAKTTDLGDGHFAIDVYENYETIGDGIDYKDFLGESRATELYRRANPWLKEGQVVEKDGEMYRITEEAKYREASTPTFGSQLYRIVTMAVPVGGGPAVEIHHSSEFE